jgi:8-amino-7-oxononanoate synthase
MPSPILQGSSATHVRVGGRELLCFGGCDYLGLAHQPEVVEAFAAAAREQGVSPGASRLTSAEHEEYLALERELAAFLGTEAALHARFDAAAHASGRQAARAAGLAVADFPHQDVTAAAAMARALAPEGVVLWCDGAYPSRNALAPAAALQRELPVRGATLVLDEAHALGVAGEGGRGSASSLCWPDPRVLLTGTFSKALGTYGGYLAGDRYGIEEARRCSPTFAGTTPPPVALARATRVALRLFVSEPWRRERLAAVRRRLAEGLERLGLSSAPSELPVFALAHPRAREVHEELLASGFLLPLTEYPGDDPPLRLRLVARAVHSDEEVDLLLAALGRALRA